MIECTIKFLASGICCFGLMFVAFALATGTRLCIAASLLATTWLIVCVAGRERIFRYARVVACRKNLVVAVISFAAVALRIIFWGMNNTGDISALQCGDGPQFWSWSQEAAAGTLPEVKSWTTVVLYATLIKFAGDGLEGAFVINFCIQFATALLLLKFGECVFGRFAGLFAFATYLLSPTFVLLTFTTLSEHMFYLFVALCMFALSKWRTVRSYTWAVFAAAFAWLATWSRGEGVILVAVAALCIAGDLSGRVGNRRSVAIALVAYLAVACLLGVGGYAFNKIAFGVRTVFCSEDNWWPRLHGANLKSHGRLDSKMPIYEQYLADHPGDPEGVMAKKKPNYCPPEIVPYVRRETARRWGAMSFMTKVGFIMEKEHYVWAHAFSGSGRDISSGLRGIVYEIAPVLVLMSAIQGLWRRRQTADFLGLVPLFVVMGMVAVLALYESNIRYGTMLLVLMPFYGMGCGREIATERTSTH